MAILSPVLRPVLRSPLWRPLGDDAVPAEARGFRLPALQFSGTGAVPIAGAGGMSLPRLGFGGAGAVGGPNGGGGMALPALQIRGAGSPVVVAAGRARIPPVSFGGAGQVGAGVSGSGRLTLPPVAFRGSGTPVLQAGGTFVLPAPRFSGTGSPIVQGSGGLAVPALRFGGAGHVVPLAAGGLSLPPLAFRGTGTVDAGAGITELDFIERVASGSGTGRTESVTLTAGSSKYVLLSIENFDNRSITAVTYAGQSLAKLAENFGASQESQAIFELRDADITTGTPENLVLTLNGASSEPLIIHLWHLAGVDQTTPINASTGPTQFVGATANLGLTTTVANCAWFSPCYNFNSASGGSYTAGFADLAAEDFVNVFTDLDVGPDDSITAVYTPVSSGNATCSSWAIAPA